MENAITYGRASAGDLEALVDCVQSCFPEREPMAVALGLTMAQYLAYSRMVCAKAIEDGLSFVARATDGTIAGFCINEDYRTAPDYSLRNLDPAMRPLFHLLEDLDHVYLCPNHASKGEVFHLYMLGVREELGSRGLATSLIQASLALAKRLGYERVVAEATGSGSQRICRKLGFVEKGAVAYGQYEYDDGFPFAGVRGVTHCRLFEGALMRANELTDSGPWPLRLRRPFRWSRWFSGWGA